MRRSSSIRSESEALVKIHDEREVDLALESGDTVISVNPP